MYKRQALTASKANGRQWVCGFANEHFYAGFPHLYWAGTPLPERFVAAAESYQNLSLIHIFMSPGR